jgi:low temperature requirement protein LtrA
LALLNRGIFKPPSLRSGYDREKERHATWLELFYDLVFVGAVSQLASILNENYSPLGVLKFSALFVPVWWAWAGHTFYLTRFDSDDVGRRILTLIQIIAVASLAPGFANLSSTAKNQRLSPLLIFPGQKLPGDKAVHNESIHHGMQCLI